MSEAPDKESKTEEATEKKIRDAVEKGNVPFSREAATLASLLGILFIISFFLLHNAGALVASLRALIDSPGGIALENRADAILLFGTIAGDAARFVLPIVAILAAAGVLSSFLQNSPRLVLDRIQPKLSRISISSGWRRIFGAQGQVEFLKAVFKLGAVTGLGVMVMRAAQYDVIGAMYTEPNGLPLLILGMAGRLVTTVVVATIVLVAADLVWSQLFWRQELRMTRQELKDEMKQADGDPIVKARLRSLARDRLRKRMIGQVPRATLVIANPTHFAVALRYVREEGGAPLVVAKGQDLIALKIREIATAHGIPVFEDKALARSLYKAVEVDQMIPPQFYKAVAELVFYLVGGRPARKPA
jgi:flagellar biosynthetic protein FlhB